jgi:S1-C subfamily serine protease
VPVALPRAKVGHLPALRLDSSAGVSVGDAVIAIGNDAAISRGNPGWPLLTVDGTVVDETSVIFSPSGEWTRIESCGA